MRRRITYMLFLVLLPLLTFAQESKEVKEVKEVKDNAHYKNTFGISIGLDKNINGYRMDRNNSGNDFYSDKPGWNIGLDYGFMIKDKFRPRIEIRYLQHSYQAGWGSANMASMDETNVRLFNLGANLHLDYLLYDKAKFQVFISPAIKWQLAADKEEKNTKLDGSTNYYLYNNIISENPGSTLGAGMSGIFKYNITRYIGATVTPEYTYFLDKFTETNDKPYQRFGVSFGVEFNFY